MTDKQTLTFEDVFSRIKGLGRFQIFSVIIVSWACAVVVTRVEKTNNEKD